MHPVFKSSSPEESAGALWGCSFALSGFLFSGSSLGFSFSSAIVQSCPRCALLVPQEVPHTPSHCVDIHDFAAKPVCMQGSTLPRREGFYPRGTALCFVMSTALCPWMQLLFKSGAAIPGKLHPLSCMLTGSCSMSQRVWNLFPFCHLPSSQPWSSLLAPRVFSFILSKVALELLIA